MIKAKKIDYKTIALIVVSTLLVASLSLAGTMAWFSATDSASNNDLLFGDAVDLSIDTTVGAGELGTDGSEFAIRVAADELLPGMKVAPNWAVIFAQSETAVLLRVKVTVNVTGYSGGTDIQGTLISALESQVTLDWYKGSDDYFYFLGDDSTSAYVMTETAEAVATGIAGTGTAVANSAAEYVAGSTVARGYADRAAVQAAGDSIILGSVIPTSATEADRVVTFFDPDTQSIRIPTAWTDELAGATIEIIFEADAVQDYLVITDNLVTPTVTSAMTVFADAGL